MASAGEVGKSVAVYQEVIDLLNMFLASSAIAADSTVTQLITYFEAQRDLQ
jgi:hypothetical protein